MTQAFVPRLIPAADVEVGATVWCSRTAGFRQVVGKVVGDGLVELILGGEYASYLILASNVGVRVAD